MRALFVLLTVLLAGQAAPREVMVLDLTGPAPARPIQTPSKPEPSKPRSFAFVGSRGDGGPQQWPIRTTLLGITPGPETGRWTVEVRLEALREVQLPRSLNKEQVDPDPTVPLPSLRRMFFLLELVEPGGETMRAPVSGPDRSVYGSDLAPGSLVTLQAGESIRVRYATRIGELIRRAKPGQPISVRARVFTFAGSYNHPALRSDNVLNVTPP
jgi:hypothetical protein